MPCSKLETCAGSVMSTIRAQIVCSITVRIFLPSTAGTAGPRGERAVQRASAQHRCQQPSRCHSRARARGPPSRPVPGGRHPSAERATHHVAAQQRWARRENPSWGKRIRSRRGAGHRTASGRGGGAGHHPDQHRRGLRSVRRPSWEGRVRNMCSSTCQLLHAVAAVGTVINSCDSIISRLQVKSHGASCRLLPAKRTARQAQA